MGKMGSVEQFFLSGNTPFTRSGNSPILLLSAAVLVIAALWQRRGKSAA